MRTPAFTYTAFVDELRRLASEAAALRALERLHEAPPFRKWRHEVTDLLARIRAIGYDVRCNIAYRHFDLPNSDWSSRVNQSARVEAFRRDIDDTLIELETMISSFDKFGAPPSKAKSNADPQLMLKVPERVTLAWLWNHVPATLWWSAAAALAVAFLLGAAIGQSIFYQEIVDKLKPMTQSDQSGKR